ncbi:MAG: DUF2726 domain-containing protein [Nitrosomonas sp.]|uniref:DUF2726 domain-containing protein n=1 Tax=Nitrosomonas sp. TaxID=42353 RepID=UPI0025FE4402|nr:DUF2726 domain-containing protein [Nitrosomonas sp.]MBY0475412.1 DUF2726 domain-containing protein [Nitrosomonas sp.]
MDTFTILPKAFVHIEPKQLLLIYIGFLLFLFTISAFLLRHRRKLEIFKYKTLGKLLSDAEHSFYLVLRQALLNEKYEIFVKVRIADVLLPENDLNRGNWKSAFNKISSKHFDYVLCDKNTLSVVAVIELDDKSHDQVVTRARDIFIEKVCETAGLKLLHFPYRANYHIQSVRDKIISSLSPPTI